MRFTITLSGSNSHIILPVHHNALIQSAIYHNLSPQLSNFLHNSGFIIDNRQFKLFAFSRILGKYKILRHEQKIQFENAIRLIITSPVHEFVHDITQILLKDGFRIGNQLLKVESLDIDIPMVDQDELLIQTLSPVVAYSTMNRPDGRRYTAYFEPREEDFKTIVIQNLLRKGKILYGEDYPFTETTFKPIGQHKQNVIKYIKKCHETIIKGYSGRFILKGDRKILQTAIDVGLGSKNSMGCGLVEIIK
ncbi:CRISPR-associated endoribonuclease Cas6 [Tepidibacillus infernus]|uniref:CRISPR-associated endoribonuclease Cas6 n=1 Tax=Tepidibacillus infernus TaxID=1806172 RepID=UPI003B74FBC1